MFVYALFVFSLAYTHGLRVNTTEGPVQGSKAVDGNYYIFYGIPYAGPTAGNNRFKAPVPLSLRSEVFHAIENNVICAQPTPRGLVGVENCLTLNVFTKNTTTPKPVIVWLNSEGYTQSNTQLYSYKRLVEHDVVFVPMNFRLSIFGFLCLGVEEAPGNAGLRDVIHGLRWIKNNIANFGGDPNNIVLMGHASGAAMVDLLTLSPQTKDLVHKAIALSGSALSPWAVAYDPIGYANMLGSKLGYSNKSPTGLAKHLMKTDINVLHTALTEFKFYNNTPLFAPCIENIHLNPDDTVLGDAPYNIMRSNKHAEIPFIYGYTNREGLMRAEEAQFGNWLSAMQNDFSAFLPVDLKLDNKTANLTGNIRHFYFGNSPIDMGTIEDFLDYEGDTLVLVPVIRAARDRAFSTNKSDVRLLEFGYMGTLNSHWVNDTIPITGAPHGAFVNYLFDDDLRPVDEGVSKSIISQLTGFAYNGTTTADHSTISWTSSWKPINQTAFNYFYYGGNGAPGPNHTIIYVEEPKINPHSQRMSFWNGIYQKYYLPPTYISSSSISLTSIFFVMLCQLVICLF